MKVGRIAKICKMKDTYNGYGFNCIYYQAFIIQGTKKVIHILGYESVTLGRFDATYNF